jgi:hypothetical protein
MKYITSVQEQDTRKHAENCEIQNGGKGKEVQWKGVTVT